MKIIDMRAVIPYKSALTLPHFKNYLDEANKRARRQLGVPDAQSAVEGSFELFLEESDSEGIKKTATFLRETGEVRGEDILELLSEYPDRFIGIPYIVPSEGENAIKKIQRYVIDGPCTAIYMEPGTRFSKEIMHGDDERIFPIYEICEREKIPVLLQYGGGVNKTDFFRSESIDHIMENFPKLKLAITHGGWPQIMQFIQLAYRHEGVYLIPDCYFTRYPGSELFQTAANGILQDKIMFGSMYPGRDIHNAVSDYSMVLKSEEVKEKVFYENAARFLGFTEEEFIFANGHAGMR